MNSDTIINILWTGGWDSTFRMIQASRQGKVIQPYYVIDTDRPSSLNEMEQMLEIKAALSRKYSLSNIKDIIYMNLASMVIDEKYTAAQARLMNKATLGFQYEWISSLSRQIENLELCIHKDDKAEFFVRKMLQERAQNGNRNSDEELIFGALQFPLLDYTKLDMEEECIQGGDLDILNLSWFCFTPINGTPCGLCNPCKYTLSEGLQRRFTYRGRLYSKAPFFFGTVRKISQKIL